MKSIVLSACLIAAGCATTQRTYQPTGPVVAETSHWAQDWQAVAENGQPSAQSDSWVLERIDDGTIRVYRQEQRVGGGALGRIDDAVVEGRVYARLAAADGTRGKGFGVSARDGVITLTGNADSSDQARDAVRVALDTEGVDEVVARLTWNNNPGYDSGAPPN